MANFDSGVSSYIAGEYTVRVYFPVDYKGRAEIACKHCPFLSSNSRTCWLNKQPVAFPDRFVGQDCPLREVPNDIIFNDKNKNDKENNENESN